MHKRAGSNVWQWCVKVPTDLRGQYETQWAHRCSLETTDLREANDRASKLHAEWRERFAAQRRALNPQRLDKVSAELGQALAQRVTAKLLQADEKLRTEPATAKLLLDAIRAAVPSVLTINPPAPPAWLDASEDPLEGLSPELAAALAQLNAGMDAHAATQWASQRAATVLPMALAEAREMGLEFDAKTPGAIEALRECLKAYRKAWEDISRRDAGDVVETPKTATAATVQQARPATLRHVFERWKGVKKRSDDSVRACERALILFEQRTENTPVQQLTRAQGDDFRSWLQTLGTSSKTAHDRITWVKSLLVYAYRDLELIQRQPWEGIDIAHRTENKRHPWTDDELKAFFKLPLFTRYELPTDFKAGKDAAYWIPLLGLYTGARVGELAQLRVQDVEVGKDGGAFIRISNEAEGARVKTDAGQRRVPVHSELVRLGFLEYVASIGGAGSLWPSMRFRKGKPGAYFSDWVNAFHKESTGNPAAPVFHELRHTVRSRLHAARIDRETIGLMLGHDTGLSEAERTYTHISDAELHRAIETLEFRQLRPARVYSSARG